MLRNLGDEIAYFPADTDWPALDLAACAVAKAPAREWMIDGWVPRYKATLLAGDGGVGKSLLAQIQATCIAAGRPFMGLETRQANAAYASWEDDADELWRRQESICAVMGISMASLAGKLHLVSFTEEEKPFLVTVDDMGLTVTTLGRKIERLVEQHSIGLLILDNASQTAGIDHNKVEDVAPFAHWLGTIAKRQSGAVILLHHTNKAGQDYLGSVAYNNQFRSRLLLARPEDCHDPNLREMTNPKANYAQSGSTIELRWHSGSFVRDEDLPVDTQKELRETIAATMANDAFLACLHERIKQGRPVSESPGPNYAPTQFVRMPEAKKLSKEKLVQAMDRLFRIGRIERGYVCWDAEKRREKHGIFDTENPPQTPAPNAPQTLAPNPAQTKENLPQTHTVYTTYINGAGPDGPPPHNDTEQPCPRCAGEGCGWCDREAVQ